MLINLCVFESQIWQDVARHQFKHVASQQLIHAAIELPDDDCYDSVVSHLAARIYNFSALFAVHMSDDHDDDLADKKKLHHAASPESRSGCVCVCAKALAQAEQCHASI